MIILDETLFRLQTDRNWSCLQKSTPIFAYLKRTPRTNRFSQTSLLRIRLKSELPPHFPLNTSKFFILIHSSLLIISFPFSPHLLYAGGGDGGVAMKVGGSLPAAPRNRIHERGFLAASADLMRCTAAAGGGGRLRCGSSRVEQVAASVRIQLAAGR